MSNLISKYNISEKDLFALGLVETKKKSASYLEKEKLKAASLKILKPYNVKFMDIGVLLGEINQGGFDNKYADSISTEDKLAVEKMIQENSNVSKSYKEFWDGKSKKQKWIIVITVLFVFGFIGSITDDKTSGSSGVAEVESIEDTKTCLIGYDWVYPSIASPTGAWKFSSDGTFNSSTTMFGGMSSWGNWKVISPGKINVSYTRSSEGIIPNDQVLTMSSCGSLKVGSTYYSKD